jgi:hypothetical protein
MSEPDEIHNDMSAREEREMSEKCSDCGHLEMRHGWSGGGWIGPPEPFCKDCPNRDCPGSYEDDIDRSPDDANDPGIPYRT